MVLSERGWRLPTGVRGRTRTLAIAVLAVGPTAAGAQAQAREGQFVSVGLGGGFDQISCDVCSGTPRSGLAGYVRFGGTLSERLLLAAEFDGWTRGDEGVRQYMGALMAVAVLYAAPEARFHVKLGAGGVGYRASEGGESLTALAPGVSAGLGYDYPISPTLSITPFANLVMAPFSSLDSNGEQAVSGATLALLQGGLSLTWH